MEEAKKEIIEFLKKETGLKEVKLDKTPNPEVGDYAFACFQVKGKDPVKTAEELAEKFSGNLVEKAETKGPYLNFFLNKKTVTEQTLKKVYSEKEKYGKSSIGAGKNIVLDYSHPNIAKPFGIGHLRSTIIGNSLKLIFESQGYKAIGINHLGDWGTQFGKLIVAYQKWGHAEELKKSPIRYLLNLYVRFHTEAETQLELSEEARAWFKKLEDGDQDAMSLWEMFRRISLDEFKKFYKILNVEFDSYNGEAYYNKKLPETLTEVKQKVKTEESEGALIVNLKDIKMTPLMLLKSDGASTYALRDIAAATDRIKSFNPEKIVYVVGNEQQLHFQQLFEVLSRMKHSKEMFKHVNFGLVGFPEGKMSTRKGNVIFLEEVLDKAIELARETIKEKNPKLENKEKIAEQVGIGAIIFGDLLNDRIRDIKFSWDKILDFEGETAPYVQYAHVRCCSLIAKAGIEAKDDAKFELLKEKEEQEIIKKIAEFNEIIQDALNHYKPSILARYLLELAQMFNDSYTKHQIILDDKELTKARLLLVDSIRQVLKNGLALLGIQSPKAM